MDRIARIVKVGVLCLAATVAGCDDEPYNLDGGDLVVVGAAYVQERGCPSCHQAADGTLSGSSMAIADTHVYAANLTSDPATGIGNRADIQLVRAMRFGIDAKGEPLCPPMPHFDGSESDPLYHQAMSDVEARAIIAYLRSLAPVVHEIPLSECPPLKPRSAIDMTMVLDGAVGD